jgi:tetratricopeptide (TPR) repeat protein
MYGESVRCSRSTRYVSALAFAMLGSLVGAVSAVAAAAGPSDSVVEVTPDGIESLVRDLGADNYSRREKAQAQLRRLGLAAFDYLCEAQDSDDIEVALRARYLLRSLAIHWASEDDPLAVKELMRGYDGKADDERRNLMDQLAALTDLRGIEPLCRLVRFEPSNVLSKRAALLIMAAKFDSPEEAARTAAVIREQIGGSRRPAADWLRLYLETLESPADGLDAWGRVVALEQETYQYTPERSSVSTVRDLLRWYADLLVRCGRESLAEDAVMSTIDLLDGTRFQLTETVDWLLHRESWDAVQEVARRFPERFEDNAGLLYRLAESQQRTGQETAARETAERALALHPEDLEEHNRVAVALQERGLFAWSEREYRYVAEKSPADEEEGVRGRFLLSEMLHDLQRDREAGDALREVVDAIGDSEQSGDEPKLLGRELGSIQSRMHYFYAEDARQRGDPAAVRQHLEDAYKRDSADADVLIAMYRMPEVGEDWSRMTREAIQKTVAAFRDEVRDFKQKAESEDREEYRSLYRRLLASAHNQFAWLVANTEGDYQEALRSSHRSLELRPDTAGFLDTLGRCYFAIGDYAKAVKYQRRAVELEPFSCQIRRQLEQFEQALSKASADES